MDFVRVLGACCSDVVDVLGPEAFVAEFLQRGRHQHEGSALQTAVGVGVEHLLHTAGFSTHLIRSRSVVHVVPEHADHDGSNLIAGHPQAPEVLDAEHARIDIGLLLASVQHPFSINFTKIADLDKDGIEHF